LTTAYFSYSLNLTESFLLPRRFSAELSGWYNAAAYNGTTKVAGIGAINAGFKKELNRNAGILQLSVTDLLSTIRYNAYYGALTEEAFSIKSHVDVNTESAFRPIIKLSYSRSFGSSSPKTQRAARQRNTGRTGKGQKVAAGKSFFTLASQLHRRPEIRIPDQKIDIERDPEE
jgi:iron complex outermembrane receptor protein